MSRPKLLDLFCCAGGAGMGYHRAGFNVTGVDIMPQPRYPFEFVQADALGFVAEHGHQYDVIHASPPCQAYTKAQRIMANDHVDLIEPTRALLVASGKPWVIENVEGAPLHNPVLLCGSMVGIDTYRHRLFESNMGLSQPFHPRHDVPVTKMGRPPADGEYMHIVGNFSGADRARQIMGMPWATRDELREAIPPAYTQLIGRDLLARPLRSWSASLAELER
jgi:DNA (cytosine-5)-methyltransferase 1